MKLFSYILRPLVWITAATCILLAVFDALGTNWHLMAKDLTMAFINYAISLMLGDSIKESPDAK